MIVLDTSAAVDLLLRTPAGERVEARLQADGGPFHSVHLIDPEVVGALTRLVRAGHVADDVAHRCLVEFAALPLARHAHESLLDRAWEIRANVKAYDAMYVVLAEAAGCPLITTDARLARAAGHRAVVECVAD